MDLFYISLLKIADKRIKRGGVFERKIREGDWMNLLSVILKADLSHFFTAS